MKKKIAPPAKSDTPVTVHITTTRGPFHQGKPLPLNAIVSLSSDMAAALIQRGWAEEITTEEIAEEPAEESDEAAS